jgi:hypothetical protein
MPSRGGCGLYHQSLESAGISFEETPLTMIIMFKASKIALSTTPTRTVFCETNYLLLSSLFFGTSTLTLRAVNVRSTSSVASTVTGVSMSISDGLMD